TAQLNGRVSDESGAVLPGVTVTATQTGTTFTRSVQVTDDVYGEDPDQLFESGRVWTGSGREVRHAPAEQHQGARLLEGRFGPVAARILSSNQKHRAAAGSVQSVQHLQLGPAEYELRVGHIRANHDADGRSAHHAVWD